MDSATRIQVENLQSSDKEIRYEAYLYLQDMTKKKVAWVYEIWDNLLVDLTHPDNHRRAIATQLLCNLAKSDTAHRMVNDFPAIVEVTKDERFVTARHTLQSLWKIGVVPEYRQMVVDGLEDRYKNCMNEKNYTLIRFDIIQGLRNLYDEVADKQVKEIALVLIELEENPKYQKKYRTAWKNV